MTPQQQLNAALSAAFAAPAGSVNQSASAVTQTAPASFLSPISPAPAAVAGPSDQAQDVFQSHASDETAQVSSLASALQAAMQGQSGSGVQMR